MQIKTITFLQSEVDWRKCPTPSLPEYAFIGRSNVGKSSLINMIANNNNWQKYHPDQAKLRRLIIFW
jgi:GTP-binding protein